MDQGTGCAATTIRDPYWAIPIGPRARSGRMRRPRAGKAKRHPAEQRVPGGGASRQWRWVRVHPPPAV
jgi:hypothetical protein